MLVHRQIFNLPRGLLILLFGINCVRAFLLKGPMRLIRSSGTFRRCQYRHSDSPFQGRYWCPPCHFGPTTTTTCLYMLPLQPPGGGRKKSGMEVGIQTAQLLMDSRRRNKLKKKMKEQYPLVPEAMLDSSIDITAQAFTQVAPEKLKIALRPGGMDRVRPEIERVIVEFAFSQQVIQNIPILDHRDKRKLVELMVTKSLDYVLQDAKEVLSSPEVRLEALEEQIKEVKLMMGPARLFWYRVRHNLLEIGVACALAVAAVSVYQWRNVPLVAQALSTSKTLMVHAARVLSLAWARVLYAVGLIWTKAGGMRSMLQKMVWQQ